MEIRSLRSGDSKADVGMTVEELSHSAVRQLRCYAVASNTPVTRSTTKGGVPLEGRALSDTLIYYRSPEGL